MTSKWSLICSFCQPLEYLWNKLNVSLSKVVQIIRVMAVLLKLWCYNCWLDISCDICYYPRRDRIETALIITVSGTLTLKIFDLEKVGQDCRVLLSQWRQSLAKTNLRILDLTVSAILASEIFWPWKSRSRSRTKNNFSNGVVLWQIYHL